MNADPMFVSREVIASCHFRTQPFWGLHTLDLLSWGNQSQVCLLWKTGRVLDPQQSHGFSFLASLPQSLAVLSWLGLGKAGFSKLG